MSDNTNTSADSGESLPTAGEVASDARTGISIRVDRNPNAYVYAKGVQREGVLATLRPGLHDPAGHRGGMSPESVVRIDGREMNLRSAERLGYVVRDPVSGEYRDAKLAKAAEQPKGETKDASDGEPKDTPEGEQQDGPAMLAEADERDLNDMLTFAQENGARPMALAAEYLAAPDRLPSIAQAIARKHRMDPIQLKGQIDRIAAAFTQQAASVVQKLGVSYDEVTAWEARNVSRGDQTRGRMMAFRGDLSYFANLARTFKQQSKPTAKDVPANGAYREARDPTDGRKVTLVKLPGYREMRVEAARLMGLL